MKQLGVEYRQSPSVTAMHDKSIDTRAFHNQSFSFSEIQRKQMQIGGKQKTCNAQGRKLDVKDERLYNGISCNALYLATTWPDIPTFNLPPLPSTPNTTLTGNTPGQCDIIQLTYCKGTTEMFSHPDERWFNTQTITDTTDSIPFTNNDLPYWLPNK